MIYIKIPQDRIGAMIGPKGAVRKQLEKRGGFKIDVDTEANEVTLHDEVEGSNPLDLLKLQDIVKAIGRGFSPEHAQRLWSDDAYFELLDIHDFVGKHKNHIRRVASRVIGAEGKTRRIVQEQTGCDLSIYGHTVGIIGDLESLSDAKHALEMLLRGAEHASVYKYLERKRREMKRGSNELWL
jgi:ribosomal RNA assembly protein